LYALMHNKVIILCVFNDTGPWGKKTNNLLVREPQTFAYA
jgi:hypothetical protein